MYTQEVAAIAAVRTIHTAQTQYRSNFHRNAGSLQKLAAAGTIQLATGANLGYSFEMAGTQDGYTISARPAVFKLHRQPDLLLRPDHGDPRALRT
jgi:hypothetical protein